MSENNFNIVNIRVTFRNIPIHKLERFSFKDVAAASESFKKIPGISECVIVQTASRVEIFTVSNAKKEEASRCKKRRGKKSHH
ncbi:hypothetical protein [Candidatus Nitrosotenuis chungbukensis]|uniref:hypothetical protein n=1 Tax=Candidatus Nitrosotenuis chungbukensis TaxID=1353246 RepID=UPI002A4E1657|nr:hypothetical protein [Candidatus Nitrosotenuis chungbukensis]